MFSYNIDMCKLYDTRKSTKPCFVSNVDTFSRILIPDPESKLKVVPLNQIGIAFEKGTPVKKKVFQDGRNSAKQSVTCAHYKQVQINHQAINVLRSKIKCPSFSQFQQISWYKHTHDNR